MLVLAVDVHQVLGQCAQQPERHNTAVHTARVASVQVDLTGEDDLFFAADNPISIQGGVHPLGKVPIEQEDTLHPGLPRPGPDHAAIGAASEEKDQRIHNDRLAGAGLPGQHVEAGRQLQFEPFYGGEVGDAKQSEHGSAV